MGYVMSLKKILGGLRQLLKEFEMLLDRNILSVILIAILLGVAIGFPL